MQYGHESHDIRFVFACCEDAQVDKVQLEKQAWLGSDSVMQASQLQVVG